MRRADVRFPLLGYNFGMPPFIAIWNCVGARNWSGKGFPARVNSMRLAVAAAVVEAGAVAAGTTWLFTAPEYAFGNAEAGLRKAAVQVSTALETKLINTMTQLTTTHPAMILAPGTIPVWEGQRGVRTARNTSYGFYNGAQVWRVDKRQGVGEVTQSEELNRLLRFRPGLGHVTAVVATNTYGVEICKDATAGGTLPGTVERHLILGQGVSHYVPGFAHLSIANKATQLQIVAEPGGYGVWDYRVHAVGIQILPYRHEDVDGVRIYYYLA